MISAPLSTHSSHPRRKRSAARRYPGQSRRLSATTRRARRPGVPSLVPPRGVRADAHIGPLLGITCGAPVGRGDHTPPPDAPSCSALYKEGRRITPIPVGSGTPPPPRRGGPVCPPVDGPREGPWPGRHMGRPLRILLQHPSTPGKTGGGPAPTGLLAAGRWGIGPYGAFLGSQSGQVSSDRRRLRRGWTQWPQRSGR